MVATLFSIIYPFEQFATTIKRHSHGQGLKERLSNGPRNITTHLALHFHDLISALPELAGKCPLCDATKF